MLRRIVIVFAALGCGKAEQPAKMEPTKPVVTAADAATVATDRVYGWYLVPDVKGSEDLRGGAMKLGPDQLVTIDAKQDVAVRACPTMIRGTSVTITGCGLGGNATVKGDTIDFGTFTVTPAPAESVKEFEALVAAGADVCPKARACYRVAWPLLGQKPDEDFDFGPGPSYSQCKGMMGTFRDMLKEKRKPIPTACN